MTNELRWRGFAVLSLLAGGLLACGCSSAAKRNNRLANELHTTIISNDSEAARKIVTNSPGAVGGFAGGIMPLHYAVMYNNTAIAELLLANGADPNDKSLQWKKTSLADAMKNPTPTPLLQAVGVQNPDMVNLLLRYKADPNLPGQLLIEKRSGNGKYMALCTPLDLAVHLENRAITAALLAGGANPNKGNNYFIWLEREASGGDPSLEKGYYMPLADAVASGNLELAAMLIEKGADVNFQNKRFRSPLQSLITQLAEKPHDLGILDLLLENGADPNLRDREGNTAIQLAQAHARLPSANNIAGLMQEYASLTPLHKAVRKGNLAAVKEMLKKGGDINAATTTGTTPLHIAARSGNNRMVKALLSLGASTAARDLNGETPLHYAARTRSVAAAQSLLGSGADINAVSGQGRTPLAEAVMARGTEMAGFLFDHGADPALSGSTGCTAFQCAILNWDSVLTRMLGVKLGRKTLGAEYFSAGIQLEDSKNPDKAILLYRVAERYGHEQAREYIRNLETNMAQQKLLAAQQELFDQQKLAMQQQTAAMQQQVAVMQQQTSAAAQAKEDDTMGDMFNFLGSLLLAKQNGGHTGATSITQAAPPSSSGCQPTGCPVYSPWYNMNSGGCFATTSACQAGRGSSISKCRKCP